MATTYDLSKVSSPAASALVTGDIINCPYTGSYKTITLPKGKYKLEVWGAQGGMLTNVGGKGGYSYGQLSLNEDTILYLYAGQCPGCTGTNSYSASTAAGWNGGGSTSRYGGGGGGASDIRIGNTSANYRVIVAGGGGGAGYDSTLGGYGGGTSGGQGGNGTATGGYGGTQSSGGTNNTPGSFGQGGTASAGGGGGGGWYGGASGTSSNSDSGGGGGSGFVYTAYNSACSLDSKYILSSAETLSGNNYFINFLGNNTQGNPYHGGVRITVMDIPVPNVVYIKTNATTWNKAKSIFIKIDANTWIEKSF